MEALCCGYLRSTSTLFSVSRIPTIPCVSQLHQTTLIPANRNHAGYLSTSWNPAQVSSPNKPFRRFATTPADQAGFTVTETELEVLMKDLLTSITEGDQGSHLDEKCLDIVLRLERLEQVPDISTGGSPDIIHGRLVALRSNFKENPSSRSGAAKLPRFLGYQGAMSTLGAATFNTVKPSDQKIALYNMYQLIHVENEESYDLITECSLIMDENSTGEFPLPGLIITKAKCRPIGPKRLEIEFISCGIKPYEDWWNGHDVDAQILVDRHSAWLTALQEAGPDQDTGRVEVALPTGIKGWTDILFMDDHIRIHRGNRGGVSVLKLLSENEDLHISA